MILITLSLTLVLLFSSRTSALVDGVLCLKRVTQNMNEIFRQIVLLVVGKKEEDLSTAIHVLSYVSFFLLWVRALRWIDRQGSVFGLAASL